MVTQARWSLLLACARRGLRTVNHPTGFEHRQSGHPGQVGSSRDGSVDRELDYRKGPRPNPTQPLQQDRLEKILCLLHHVNFGIIGGLVSMLSTYRTLPLRKYYS